MKYAAKWAFALGFLSCLFFSVDSSAQARETALKKMYMELGFGPATHSGFAVEAGLQAVLKNDWLVSLSYAHLTMNPKNLPDDYDPGYEMMIIVPVPNSYPEQSLKVVGLSGGKYFRLSRSTWCSAEAGITYANGMEFTFQRQAVTNGWGQDANYATTRKEKSSLGGLLKGDIKWAFSSFAGLGAGGFIQLNSVQSSLGAEVKLILGWMNRGPRK